MKNQKVKFVLVLIIAVVLVFVGTAAIFIVRGEKEKEEYEAVIGEKEAEIQRNTKIVYVPVGTIDVGDIITAEKVQKRSIISGIPYDYFIVEADLGGVAAVTIDANIPILKTMIAQKEELVDGLYEIECGYFWLNSNLVENDSVDIRISFPNGEDFVVVAKKGLKSLSLTANNVFLWLTEDEILTLSSAIVDAATHTGTKLYTAKYVSPLIQAPSAVTYVPNEDVTEAIRNNPNIVAESAAILSAQARKDLDERLKTYKVDTESDEVIGVPSEIISVEPNQSLIEQNQPAQPDTTQEPTPTPVPVKVGDNSYDY